MSKVKLDAVYRALLSEGEESATKMMREYVLSTCIDINNRIINEDDLSFDAVETDETENSDSSGAAFLTVAYADPEGDCPNDSAIISALGRDDMDGAGWADGIRTLSFQYSSEEEAQSAADDLQNSEDESLPVSMDTVVDSFDFGADSDDTEETVEEDDSFNDGTESPLSDTQPETCNSLEEDESEDDVTVDVDGGDLDVDASTDEDSDECSILSQMDDLTADIEDLKNQIAARLGEGESEEDLDESFDFEKVNIKTATTDGVEAGGKKVQTNDESVIPGNTDMDHRADGAHPIEIKDPNPHNGYAREPAPPVKSLDLGKNVRRTAEQDMSKVSKEGDKSALINKSFPEENDTSIISGKDD